MREIIFRGKRVDNGEWVFGYYVAYTYETYKGDHATDAFGHFIIEKKENDWQRDEDEHVQIIPETVCQFIGRKDNWCKDIFEKDIMRVSLSTQAGGTNRKTKDFNLLVEWNDHDAGFHLVYPENYDSYRFMDGIWQSHDIVGNIFDNPEILSK